MARNSTISIQLYSRQINCHRLKAVLGRESQARKDSRIVHQRKIGVDWIKKWVRWIYLEENS
jgi:hypothetical protein